MASVLHRINKRFIKSANTPDYKVSEWIINPDMSEVKDFHSKYWVITGDLVELSTQSGRDSIDLAEQQAAEAAEKAAEEARLSSDAMLKAVVKVMMDELNVIRERIGMQLLTGPYIRNKIKGEL